MKLHLGVIDIPYKEGQASTGDVAEYLEAKYTIMEYFFETHKDTIAALMAADMAMQLETILAGAPPSQEFLAESMDEIQHLFIQFIKTKQMDGITGIPTKRSLMGISKRYKRRKKRAPRPSFIDTGNYIDSFRAWADGHMDMFDD